MNPTTALIDRLKAEPAMSGLRRSLEVYYGDPWREGAMDALHARFIGAGDLAFDIGSHVGDHIGSFRRLGARVVAVEPHPLCVRAIRSIYPADPQVALVQAACGAERGKNRLHVNSVNPTVSTVSTSFIHRADGAAGWESEVWDSEIEVESVTLDALVADHGVPSFVKIDVEGHEDAVLAGLSAPLPALSFEFTTINRDVALDCLDRLTSLGPYRFDVSLGDSQVMTFNSWISKDDMARHIRALPQAANSGDIFCISHIQPVAPGGTEPT